MIIFGHFRSQTGRHFLQEGVGELAGWESVEDALTSVVADGGLDDAGGLFLLQVGHKIAQRAFGVDRGIFDDDVGVGHRE